MLLLGALLLACGTKPQPYNVILITLDTTRADYLSCYGSPNAANTPYFDGIAAQGTLFERAIAQASVTPVSHASILTGLYQYQHGVRVLYASSGYRLDPAVPRITTVLRDKGWRTGAFLSAFPVSEQFGFDTGFEVFDNGIQAATDTVLQESGDGRFRWNVARNQRRSDVTTDRAIAWIDEIGKDPFFTWIHYWDPHDMSLKPPAEVVSELVPRGTVGDEYRRKMYAAEVQYVDSQFGRLVEHLKATGKWDRTIVIVTSDHGEGLGDHDWWNHRILYQEQIRVPLLVRIPGETGGKRVSSIVRTIDAVPTLYDWLDVAPEGHIEGRTLLPLMRGEPDEPRIAYADQLNMYDTNANMVARRPNDDLLYCAVDDNWKLIYRPRHPDLSELYHIAEDPGELQNLYHKNHPEALRLRAYLDESGGYVDGPFGESMDEETKKRLEALGYVD